MRLLSKISVCIVAAASLSRGPFAVAQENSGHHQHHDVAGMDVIPGDSLYQLSVALQSADGKTLKIAELRGQPLVVTMFYSHCTSVCPLITAQVRRLVSDLTPAERQRIRVLMVSFDSLRDTSEALSDFKAEHHIQEANWIIARASASDVRALAAALGIRYRELSDHTFNHSAIISVTDRDGTVRARTSEMTGPDDAFVGALRAQIAASWQQRQR
jgi:protein SCO1/2